MTTSNADPIVGRVVDNRYEVQRLIAHGGMASVYLAVDTRLERNVALKVLHPHLSSNESFVRRFYREAKSAAAITNPHIVAMYDQGHDGELCFLVMEYVAGNTLRHMLQTRPNPNRGLTDDQVSAIAIPVVEALVAAHDAGLIHRDIKPENVLISTTGQVKVADFGLARAAGTSTATSTVLGTVAYAAPEVLHADIPDQRSDMYSFGIMLFELVTGRLPFTGDAPLRIAFLQVNEPIVPPSVAYEGSSALWDEIILWTAAKDPSARPHSARELLARLRVVLPNRGHTSTQALRTTAPMPRAADRDTTALPQPVPARPDRLQPAPLVSTAPVHVTGTIVSSTIKPQRRRWLAPVISAALVIVLGGSGWVWWNESGPGSLRTLPAVSRMAVKDAQTVLQKSELASRTVETFSDAVPAGTVISTQPAPGDVPKNSTVTLTVSKGPEFTNVPDVTNRPQAEAEQLLKDAGLSITVPEPVFDEIVPAGKVISQSIAAKERVKQGTQVSIQVSKGREPLTVPTDLAGQTQADATNSLEDLGFTVAVTTEFSDDVAADTVISSNPNSGELYRGDTVNLVVSKGPELFAVPNVVGKSLSDAKQVLEGAGFTVKSTSYPLQSAMFNLVRAQTPGANKMVAKGTLITLNLV